MTADYASLKAPITCPYITSVQTTQKTPLPFPYCWVHIRCHGNRYTEPFPSLLFKNGNHASVNKYRPISILNDFSKLSEFITHEVSHYVKLDHCQHCFTNYISTVTSLVTFLDYITPLAHSQHQTDAISISAVHLT
jgi:hypothetical protein